MKKTFSLFLAVLLLFSLAACGSSEPSSGNPSEPATETPVNYEVPVASETPAENTEGSAGTDAGSSENQITFYELTVVDID